MLMSADPPTPLLTTVPQERKTTTPPGVTGSGDAAPHSAPPDWNLIHFDVHCPRCGHDLRGLDEAQCPACSLTLDWSAVAPLEALTCLHCGYHLYGLSAPRCPECGQSFDWNEVLDVYRRSHAPYFEYQYRRNPFRAFMDTVRRSLRPWRFWSRITLNHPPRTGALFIFWTASVAFLIAVSFALDMGYGWMIEILESYSMNRPMFYWGGRRINFAPIVTIAMMLVAWTTVMFLTLASMRWSLKACRVRTAHVFRACVYVTPIFLPPSIIFYTAMFVGDVLVLRGFAGRGAMSAVMEWFFLAMITAVLIFCIVHLKEAYRRYIKMRHAWGVALAANVAATLAAMIAGTICKGILGG